MRGGMRFTRYFAAISYPQATFVKYVKQAMRRRENE
jgi:hypothetical protein